MKKLLLLSTLALALIHNVFATGTEGVNPPQSGTLTFNGATGLSITNPFSFSYSSQPAVIIYPQATNNNPFTVSAVTISNFVLTVTSGATTNTSVNWISYAGYPRVQVGTNAITANAFVTNAFPYPFVLPPIINIEGSTTNGVGISSVTTTNFVETSNAAQSVYWGAFGVAYTPGLNTVTY